MKADPFLGRFGYVAKALGQALDQLGKLLAENEGAVPQGAHGFAEGIAQSCARAWRDGDSSLFRDLAALCARQKDTGFGPGAWEHVASFYASRVLHDSPTRKRSVDSKGRIVVTVLPVDLTRTAADVVALAKSEGVNIPLRDAQRAMQALVAEYGGTRRAGRRKGSADSPATAKARQARKRRSGAGDSGLLRM